MQGNNILTLFLICLIPTILILTNVTIAEERIDYVCNSENFKEFPTEELGDCHEYGQMIINYVYIISIGVIILAITIMYYYDKTHPYIEHKFECQCGCHREK